MVAENLTQEKIDLTPDSEQAPITPPVEEVKPEPDIPEVQAEQPIDTADVTPVEETPPTPEVTVNYDTPVDEDMSNLNLSNRKVGQDKNIENRQVQQLNRRPKVDVERIKQVDLSQSEEFLFSEVLSTGNLKEDAILKNQIDTAVGFYTPFDEDGNVLPGAIIDGNVVLDKMDFVKFRKTNTTRVRSLIKNGSVILAQEVLPSMANEIGVRLQEHDDGNMYVNPFSLPQFEQNLDLTGKEFVGNDIKYEEPALIQRVLDFFYTSEADKDRTRRRYANLLVKNGINNPFMINRMLDLHDKGILKTIEFNEGVNDLGRFFANVAIGIANLPDGESRAGGPLGVSSEEIIKYSSNISPDVQGQGIDSAMDNPEAMAFLQMGADTMIESQIVNNPEEADKVVIGPDGKKRLRFEYYDYAADKLAESMGITSQQADRILSFNDDAFEYLKEMAPEALTFAAGEALYVTARSAQMFKSFQGYMRKKYPKAKSYEETIDQLNKAGGSLTAELNTWAQDATPEFLRRVKLYNFSVQRKMDLVSIGASTTGTFVAGSEIVEQAIKRSQQFNEDAMSDFSKAAAETNIAKRFKLKASGFSKIVQAQKALHVDRYVPKVVSELAGDEFWAAGGSAATGHFMTLQFGEDTRPAGEFLGAIMGLTYLRKGTKAFARGAINLPFEMVPGGRAAYVSIVNGFNKFRGKPENAGIGFGTYLKRQHVKTYNELFADLAPEQQQQIENTMLQFAELEERLMNVRLPDGRPAFKEGEIPTLLADITGLTVLKEMTDYFNSRMLASDVIGKGEIIQQASSVVEMRQKLSNKIGVVLDRMSTVEPLQDSPELNSIIETFGKMKQGLETSIKEDARIYGEALDEIEEKISLVLGGGVTFTDEAGQVVAINARDILEQRHRQLIERYTGENGVIDDIDGYLLEVEQLGKTFQDAFSEISKDFSDVRVAKTENNVSINFVSRMGNLKDTNREVKDAKYETFRSQAPDARMDGTEIYNRLEQDLYSELDADMNVDIEIDTELSKAEKASILLAAGDAPKKTQRKHFWNASAMEEMRNNPIIAQAAGITDDMTDQEVINILAEFKDELAEGIEGLPGELRELGNTPIDVFNFFRKTALTADPEQLAKFGMTREFGERLTLPMTPRTMHNLTKFLSRSVKRDENGVLTPESKAMINLRKEIIDMSEDSTSGFQLNYYGERQPVGSELVKTLRDANTFNREYNMRFHNPDVKTYGIELRDTETTKKASQTLDDMIEAGVNSTRGRDPNIINETLGSDLARSLGSPLSKGPTGRDGFFLVEGDDATQAAKEIMLGLVHTKLWRSDGGQEILRLAREGQGIGYEISGAQLNQIKDLMGSVPTIGEVKNGSELLDYIDALSQLKVYTRNADGSIDPASARPLLSEDEMLAPLNIENFFDLKSAAPGRTSPKTASYSQKALEVGRSVKKAIAKLRAMPQKNKLQRESALNNIKLVVDSMKSIREDKSTFIFNVVTNTNGMNLMRQARDKHVKDMVQKGIPEDVARKSFDSEITSLIMKEVSTGSQNAKGVLDPDRMAALGNNKELMAAMEEFSPESTQILKDLIELSGSVLDRNTGKMKLTGFATPYNIDTEINKIWAVSTGRGSLRWWGLQLLARQGRQLNQQTYRAMLEDPELGRTILDMIKSGKKPSEKTVERLFDTMLTYTALDIYRYGTGEDAGFVSGVIDAFGAPIDFGVRAANVLFNSKKSIIEPQPTPSIIPQSYEQLEKRIKYLQGADQ